MKKELKTGTDGLNAESLTLLGQAGGNLFSNNFFSIYGVVVVLCDFQWVFIAHVLSKF